MIPFPALPQQLLCSPDNELCGKTKLSHRCGSNTLADAPPEIQTQISVILASKGTAEG